MAIISSYGSEWFAHLLNLGLAGIAGAVNDVKGLSRKVALVKLPVQEMLKACRRDQGREERELVEVTLKTQLFPSCLRTCRQEEGEGV